MHVIPKKYHKYHIITAKLKLRQQKHQSSASYAQNNIKAVCILGRI